ncbi:MaoC/PaaZ C-terminal domain-containing protein [Bradyrhizobium sp. Pha-3]|uniref:MaoC/PaaZ C-terminal domain-containing protein n=1 Tax=Bradyrhizobium sp. Pha-3 TaxID=208375 RepID=UPI0035D4553B
MKTDSPISLVDIAELSSATAEFDFVVGETEQQAFASISGDFNPLHLDPEFARGRGLKGAVVYGAMIVAQISRIIGMRLPGSAGIWSSLKIDFREPLYVGEAAHIFAEVTHYSEAARSLSLKIKVASGERTIATASALATLHLS